MRVNIYSLMDNGIDTVVKFLLDPMEWENIYTVYCRIFDKKLLTLHLISIEQKKCSISKTTSVFYLCTTRSCSWIMDFQAKDTEINLFPSSSFFWKTKLYHGQMAIEILEHFSWKIEIKIYMASTWCHQMFVYKQSNWQPTSRAQSIHWLIININHFKWMELLWGNYEIDLVPVAHFPLPSI